MREEYIRALLELTSTQSGPTVEAAIVHLVGGLSQREAAAMYGVTPPAVSRMVRRIKEVEEKVKAATAAEAADDKLP